MIQEKIKGFFYLKKSYVKIHSSTSSYHKREEWNVISSFLEFKSWILSRSLHHNFLETHDFVIKFINNSKPKNSCGKWHQGSKFLDFIIFILKLYHCEKTIVLCYIRVWEVNVIGYFAFIRRNPE